jgi:predicted exporter
LTFFSVLANVIALGLAIDYAVFLLEGMESEAPSLLAILLSTISIALSFGLLGVSSTPVLRSFGLSLFLGVLVSMILSPIVIGSKRKLTVPKVA